MVRSAAVPSCTGRPRTAGDRAIEVRHPCHAVSACACCYTGVGHDRLPGCLVVNRHKPAVLKCKVMMDLCLRFDHDPSREGASMRCCGVSQEHCSTALQASALAEDKTREEPPTMPARPCRLKAAAERAVRLHHREAGALLLAALVLLVPPKVLLQLQWILPYKANLSKEPSKILHLGQLWLLLHGSLPPALDTTRETKRFFRHTRNRLFWCCRRAVTSLCREVIFLILSRSCLSTASSTRSWIRRPLYPKVACAQLRLLIWSMSNSSNAGHS